MTTFISNLKKRFSIKPTTTTTTTTINIQENDDENEIKKLNNNNNSNENGQLKKVFKRKKSVTEDSSDESSSGEDNNNGNDDSENSDIESDKVKKSVSFKEQPKPTLMSNKQLSAIPKSKRKSIIIQPSINNNNNNNNNSNNGSTGIDTTTTRDNSINQPLPPMKPKTVLTNIQISEIYANCIKLSTENKINQKNSWTLKLIDHFDDVLENQHAEGNTTNFQAASCVLDASVKIYSNRVDSVHVDTYKILGGLSRAERDEGKNNDGDEDDESQGGDNQQNENNKNKKKRKKSGVNTLEQNIDNITIKKFDLQFMVDPLFGKTSAAFDEGGAKGLLLNNLSIYGDCKLVFDSNDAIYSKSTTANTETPTLKSNSSKTVDISHWKHLFTPNSTNSLEICPTYLGFSDWSVKSQAGLSFDTSDIIKKNQNNDKNQNQINNDNDNNFLNMDDGSSDDFQSSHQNQQQQLVPQEDEIDLNKLGNNGQDDGDMGMHFGGGDDEFDGVGMGYDEDHYDNDSENRNNNEDNLMGILDTNQDWDQLNLVEPNQNQNWTGPEHWKFSKRNRKQINKDEEAGEGDGEVDAIDPKTNKKKRRTPKKKAFLLDFDSAPPPESMFEPGKGSTLTAASLKKASETSTILPPDIHYDIKMLSRLFNKPKCSIPPMSKRDEVLKFLRPRGGKNVIGGDDDNDIGDDDNGNQDYDFPNSQIIQDDFNPSANKDDDYGDFGGSDGDGDGGGMTWDDGHRLNGESRINNQDIGNENNNTKVPFTIGLNGGVLIEEPRKVNRIDINYARVSKKIDVKSLKTSVWGLIKSSDNITPNNNSVDENDDDAKETTINNNNNNNQHSFGTLIDNLKDEQNQLRLENKPTAGEVSIPLAFICVLHLANEKNLTLNQNNINDFFISK